VLCRTNLLLKRFLKNKKKGGWLPPQSRVWVPKNFINICLGNFENCSSAKNSAVVFLVVSPR